MKWFLLMATITAGVCFGTILATHSATLYARGQATLGAVVNALYNARNAIGLTAGTLFVVGVIVMIGVAIEGNREQAIATQQADADYARRVALDPPECKAADEAYGRAHESESYADYDSGISEGKAALKVAGLSEDKCEGTHWGR